MRVGDSRIRRLVHSGASLAVTIPVEFVRALGLKHGDEMRVYVTGRVVVIQPSTADGFAPAVIPIGGPRPAEEVVGDE